MRLEPWTPTVAQRVAAQRLADNVYHGAMVKSRVGGIAEARTIEMGEKRLYLIGQDGQVTLVEAVPTRSYLLGRALLFGGVTLVVTMVLLMIALQIGHIRTDSQLGWAGGLTFFGAVLAFVGQGLLSPSTPDGEHWVNIGAPD
jgi:hypothetical protein